MNYISIPFIILLTLLPPFYWTCIKPRYRPIFLLITSFLWLFFVYSYSLIVCVLLIFMTTLVQRYNRFLIFLMLGLIFILYKIFIGSNLPAPTIFSTSRLIGVSYLFLRLSYFVTMNQAMIFREKVTLWLYFLFVPIFSAGPVVRPDQFLQSTMEIYNPRPSFSSLNYGLYRITAGFSKKIILILSPFSSVPELISNLSSMDTIDLWKTLYLYGIYIYLDFSGYCDLAIGFSRILGIRVTENFHFPYVKRNISLFWQNWHRTLADWLRVMIYNPLVRKTIIYRWKELPAVVLVSVVTMVVCGLWHDVEFNFVLWGLWHGIGIASLFLWRNLLNLSYFSNIKAFWERSRGIQIFSTLLTFHFVTVGWLFFVADLSTILQCLPKLVGIQ